MLSSSLSDLESWLDRLFISAKATEVFKSSHSASITLDDGLILLLISTSEAFKTLYNRSSTL